MKKTATPSHTNVGEEVIHMSTGMVDDYGEVKPPTPIAWKTPYNHNTEFEALRCGTVNNEPSMTQQHQADDADINVIVKRFMATGQLPQIPMPPTMQDFDEVWDFQTAMNTILAAKDSFMKLPAAVRSKFDNDPAGFVAYVDKALEAGNIDELREWGLAVPKAAPPEPPKPPEGPKT